LASDFSLQGQRKVTKRKALPLKSTAGIGVGSRDFPTRHPWLVRKTARVLRAALRVLLRTAMQAFLAARAAASQLMPFAYRALAIDAKNAYHTKPGDNP
jgi:hypothetical protein